MEINFVATTIAKINQGYFNVFTINFTLLNEYMTSSSRNSHIIRHFLSGPLYQVSNVLLCLHSYLIGVIFILAVFFYFCIISAFN